MDCAAEKAAFALREGFLSTRSVRPWPNELGRRIGRLRFSLRSRSAQPMAGRPRGRRGGDMVAAPSLRVGEGARGANEERGDLEADRRRGGDAEARRDGSKGPVVRLAGRSEVFGGSYRDARAARGQDHREFAAAGADDAVARANVGQQEARDRPQDLRPGPVLSSVITQWLLTALVPGRGTRR